MHRGLALTFGRRQVLVQDEIRADTSADVWWFMHTPAEIEITDGGRRAVLGAKGKTLEARLLAPSDGELAVRDAQPLPSSPDPPPQADNEGIRKLTVHRPEVTDGRIAVLLTPRRAPPCRRSGPSTSGSGALIEEAELRSQRNPPAGAIDEGVLVGRGRGAVFFFPYLMVPCFRMH